MKVSLHNRVKIYNLTSGKSLPDWAEANSGKKRKQHLLAHGNDSSSGLELVQDLDFPHFCRCLFRTADGSHFFAAGDYPPRLKCFDVQDMSQKFSFNADMPICGGVSLSPDFRRFALRSDNRQITVHNTAHIVDRLRVPHTQRCMTYHENTAELLSGGNSSEVFRISLDSGAFVPSFKTCSEEGVNAIDFFHGHGLTLTGGDNGVVEAWDPRASTDRPSGAINVAALDEVDGGGGGSSAAAAVTAFAVDEDSQYIFCAGTSTGQVAVFDIRTSKPLFVKDHMSEMPIVKILFHHAGGASSSGGGADDDDQVNPGAAVLTGTGGGKTTRVISADTRSVKIWDRETGANMTAVEAPNADIYDIMVCKQDFGMAVPPYRCADSGVLMIACDAPKVQVHFIPDLGRAPKWCTFLDSMAESFDEQEITTIYDDYKFISNDEAKTLGITEQAISAGKVRPAMHGFFVEISLYRDLKSIADPGAWARGVEERKKERRRDKMDNRISNFKRTKEEEDDDANEDIGDAGGHDTSSATPNMKALIKSLPQDVRPLLKEMTPETLELLSRDPRFSSKVGKGKFTFDAKNPEFVKLFRQIGEKRQAAAERRTRYDQSNFKVVPTSAEEEQQQQQQKMVAEQQQSKKNNADDDEEDHWAREALRSSGKRRSRSAAAAADAEGQQEHYQQQQRRGANDVNPRRLNLATLQKQQQNPKQQQQQQPLLLEAGKDTAVTSSDKTMHSLRKLQRHKTKLTLEERLKRGN